jgi:hypothetical protein
MKAIETIYKGYRMRSRLEARYGIFFDSLGVKWEYEKEGFDLEGKWYLPDFWLPEQKCWIEIKGQEPTPAECYKAELLAWLTEKEVFIFAGDCWIPEKDKKHPSRYAYNVQSFEKGHVSFYNTNIPWPLEDRNILYKDRSDEEKLLIDKWNQDTYFREDNISILVANLFRPLGNHICIRLEAPGVECCVSSSTPHIILTPDEYCDTEEEDIGKPLDEYAKDLEANNDVIDFLKRREGWNGFYFDGRTYAVGWGECHLCHTLEITGSGVCLKCREHTPRPYPQILFDSPRLIAAYTAARQARFEHGESPR